MKTLVSMYLYFQGSNNVVPAICSHHRLLAVRVLHIVELK